MKGRAFKRPVVLTCPEFRGALKRSEEGSIIKFGRHIRYSYTAEATALAQIDDLEKVMRAAVKFLASEPSSAFRWPSPKRVRLPSVTRPASKCWI
jgi:hypothetical protein